jgi:hypothetical protein
MTEQTYLERSGAVWVPCPHRGTGWYWAHYYLGANSAIAAPALRRILGGAR